LNSDTTPRTCLIEVVDTVPEVLIPLAVLYFLWGNIQRRQLHYPQLVDQAL
jgi:hypothetical protein